MDLESTEISNTLQRWLEISMHRSMQHFIRHFKISGLSMTQVYAMFFLYHADTCGVTDIGEHLDISSAAASQMVEKLVQQGYLARTEGLHDRRLKQIRLTDSGRNVITTSLCARQQWLDDLAAKLTPAEQDQVVKAIAVLLEKNKVTTQPEG